MSDTWHTFCVDQAAHFLLIVIITWIFSGLELQGVGVVFMVIVTGFPLTVQGFGFLERKVADQLQKENSLKEAISGLKDGSTSKVFRLEFPELGEFMWRDSFWADGYSVESVGVSDERMIRKYIRE